jgi:hypothetical protein
LATDELGIFKRALEDLFIVVAVFSSLEPVKGR